MPDLNSFPFSSRRSFLRSLAVAAPVTRLLRAQERPVSERDKVPSEKETTFSTDVKVINVFATVRDKQGKIVSTLQKDDFILTEDGRNEPIRYFSRESD